MSPRVKICGLTRIADLEWAIACGADAIGLVMAPSPRQVDNESARTLLSTAGPHVIKVAVFRSLAAADPSRLAAIGFDAIQGEGQPAAPCALPVLPVINDGPGLHERAASALRSPQQRAGAGMGKLGNPALLLDGPLGGGGGVAADHRRARELAGRHRIVLAGGLTPDSVARSVEAVGPVAVDVSSGIESGPGIKDHELVKAFIEAARSTATSMKPSP